MSAQTINKHLFSEKEYKRLGINPQSKAFKRFDNAGLLNNIDESYVCEIQSYWKHHYGKEIDPTFHLAFMNLTEKKEPKLVPSLEMWNEIIPFFNDMNIRIGYSDKNIYDTLINPESSAETVLKRIRGHYFDTHNNNIDAVNALRVLLDKGEDLIIKPSDSDNGTGIAKLHFKQGNLYLNDNAINMTFLEELYGFNFTVQKVIEQHSVMATPHPASVNTLRMVTFRWNNEIKHLLTYARFGGNNQVKDHAISGGVSVGVTDDGKLMNFALDTHCNIHTHHPTTNFDFSNEAQIPNYPDFIKYIKHLHTRILHHDLVSWDIAVGVNGQPIFIESNFRGTSWRYQLVSQKPLFGELTEEVLEYVSTEFGKNKFKRNIKSSLPRLKRQNKKLKKENKQLTAQTKKLTSDKSLLNIKMKSKEAEVKKLQKEYGNIVNSSSWKITSPFRQLGKFYKMILKK